MLSKDTRKGSPASIHPAPCPLNWNQISSFCSVLWQGGVCTSHPQPGPSACRCLRNANGHELGEGLHQALLRHLLPIKPSPLPLQTLPPPPATCSFHEPITMARFFCSSEATGTTNKSQMQEQAPAVHFRAGGFFFFLPQRTPSRQGRLQSPISVQSQKERIMLMSGLRKMRGGGLHHVDSW